MRAEDHWPSVKGVGASLISRAISHTALEPLSPGITLFIYLFNFNIPLVSQNFTSRGQSLPNKYEAVVHESFEKGTRNCL